MNHRWIIIVNEVKKESEYWSIQEQKFLQGLNGGWHRRGKKVMNWESKLVLIKEVTKNEDSCFTGKKRWLFSSRKKTFCFICWMCEREHKICLANIEWKVYVGSSWSPFACSLLLICHRLLTSKWRWREEKILLYFLFEGKL